MFISNLFMSIPSLIFYNLAYKCFKRKIKNSKLALNSTSIIHASSSVVLGIYSLYNPDKLSLLRLNSSGYLIFDFLYIILKGKFDLLRIMYIYHHISTFLYIQLPPSKSYWPFVILFAELSNLPNYIVYFSMKKDLSKNLGKNYKSLLTKRLQKIQLYFYALFRILVLGYFGIKELTITDKPSKVVYMTSVLYIFGLIWFFAMLKQNSV